MKTRLYVLVCLVVCLTLGAGALAAYAEEPTGFVLVEGPTVYEDAKSPTGYTVTFVYKNDTATRVQLAGDLELRDLNDPPAGYPSPGIRYQPEEWQPGRYHVGGREFRRDMMYVGEGYWVISIPMHAGGLSYWYRVWDPAQGWEDKRIWDPTSTHPRPPAGFSWRENRNDVLDAVYVPYHEKQNVGHLQIRGTYEIPVANEQFKGTVQYVEYETILGTKAYLGIYLPAGYDPNREQPYPVLYASHGGNGDETDWMIPGNAPNILDNLIARNEIEPTILVTMGNSFISSQEDRAKNIAEYVIPFIEANYNVSQERFGRAYAGFSMGSMLGVTLINNYHELFGYYGLFCARPGSIDHELLVQTYGEDLPFLMIGNGIFEDQIDLYIPVINTLREAGIPVVYHRVAGAHDMMTVGQLFTIFGKDYLWKPIQAQ